MADVLLETQPVGYARHSTDRGIVEYMARCRLLRAPLSAELEDLSSILSNEGFDGVSRTLDIWASNEKPIELGRSAIISRMLSTFTFYQKDMGSLNELAETDIFVISGPKSGTTTLTNSFRARGDRVFAIHNDNWLRYYMPNARVLEAWDVKFEEMFAQLKPKRPVIFFGFREPISWYFALAGELKLPMSKSLQDDLPINIYKQFPWNILSFEKSQAIVEEILGISIVDLHFDRELGYAIHPVDTAELILYRVDALDSLLAWLVADNRISQPLRARVNDAEDYRRTLGSARYEKTVLDRLFDDPLVEYFYSEKMIAEIKDTYLRR